MRPPLGLYFLITWTIAPTQGHPQDTFGNPLIIERLRYGDNRVQVIRFCREKVDVTILTCFEPAIRTLGTCSPRAVWSVFSWQETYLSGAVVTLMTVERGARFTHIPRNSMRLVQNLACSTVAVLRSVMPLLR